MTLTYRDQGINGTQLDVLCGDIVIANVYKPTLSSVAHGDLYWPSRTDHVFGLSARFT